MNYALNTVCVISTSSHLPLQIRLLQRFNPLKHFSLITIPLCLLPLTALAGHTVTPAQQSVDVFTATANLLPCPRHIADTAESLGYSETAQTRIDTDYAETEYSETSGHSLMTVASEVTPIGTQFSLALDIPQTDQAYADELSKALRASLSLPAPAQIQNLATGTAQSWNTTLPGGDAQILVTHSDMTTQLIALMSPLTPGNELPC